MMGKNEKNCAAQDIYKKERVRNNISSFLHFHDLSHGGTKQRPRNMDETLLNKQSTGFERASLASGYMLRVRSKRPNPIDYKKRSLIPADAKLPNFCLYIFMLLRVEPKTKQSITVTVKMYEFLY